MDTKLIEAKARLEVEKRGFEEKLLAKVEETILLQGRVRELEEVFEKSREVVTTLEDDKKRFEEKRQVLEKDLACLEQERSRLVGEVEKSREETNKMFVRIKDLEEKLGEEEKAHAKAKAHALRLEATLLDLEKKIDALISPPAAHS